MSVDDLGVQRRPRQSWQLKDWVAVPLLLEKTSYPHSSPSTRTLVLPVMLSRHGTMVATVGFLRGEPQDCNQSLCQKWAPWLPLQLIQPNNKQQITALAALAGTEPPPPGRGARKRGAFSRHRGSRAGSSFSYGRLTCSAVWRPPSS